MGNTTIIQKEEPIKEEQENTDNDEPAKETIKEAKEKKDKELQKSEEPLNVKKGPQGITVIFDSNG
ncbi:MAG: hypothetical protein K6E76_05180 [Patescibacteria group bacterium]|nr:hypothetical protein [Patescibacteria group bacterium]